MGLFRKREPREPAAEREAYEGFLLQTDGEELANFDTQDLEDALVDLVEQPFLTVVLTPQEPVAHTTFLQAAPFDGPDGTLWFDLHIGLEGEPLRVLHWPTPDLPTMLAVFYQYYTRRAIPDLTDWEEVDLSDAQELDDEPEEL